MLRRPPRNERYTPAFAQEADAHANGPEVNMTESMITRPARDPLPTAPAPRPSSLVPDRPTSVIDASSSFDGKFEAAGDLVIQGAVSGEILCRGQLTVEKEATARARIDARDAYIVGRVEGDIACSGRLTIAATAVVTGTVKAAALVVEEGATIKGSVETSSVAAASESGSPAVARAALRRQAAEAEAGSPGPSGGAAPARWSRSREVPSFAVVPSEERQPSER